MLRNAIQQAKREAIARRAKEAMTNLRKGAVQKRND
jgi:hypothetical protein